MEGQLPECTPVSPFLPLVAGISRLKRRVEAYLVVRGQEFLAQLGQAQSEITHTDGVSPEHLRQAFAPGSGMENAPTTAPEVQTVNAKPSNRRFGKGKGASNNANTAL